MKGTPMWRLKNKISRKYIILFLLVLVLGLLFTAILGDSSVQVLMITIAFLSLIVQLWIIDVRRSLEQLEKGVKNILSKENELFQKSEKMSLRLETIAKNETLQDEKSSCLPEGDSKERAQKQVSRPIEKSIAMNGQSQTKLVEQLFEIGDIDSIVPLSRREFKRNLNVMVIADEFTAAAFAKEWNQFSPTPDNFREMLESQDIDLLFVESAWEANGGSWRYHLVGSMAPRDSLKNLVSMCKEKGIPTAFWNKEDPPHFEDFLKTASLFDFVFTTEEALLSEYQNRLGHDRVFVLPFAAQPFYHNPARINGIERRGVFVFGGMYFREKYPERRQQMDYLLPAAKEFGLDIYSRNSSEEKYRFDEKLQSSIRGTLTYPQMVAAYHSYKAVLNVNSVPNSKSMCARRIFEATACGAAVVSPFTEAIPTYFPENEIFSVTNQGEARSRLRAISRSEFYRKRQVHKAQRRIWEEHTYSQRVDRILEEVGLTHSAEKVGYETISVIVTTNRPNSMRYLVGNIQRQQGVTFELILITHGFEISEDARELLEQIPHVSRLVVEFSGSENKLGRNLNRLVKLSKGEFIVRMDDDDWYGPSYVRDLRNAAVFSGADLVGKAETHIYFEEKDATVVTFENHEHRYTKFIRGATFAGPRATFETFPFPELGRSEDSAVLDAINKANGLIYSADSFNFVVNRFADKSRHTWKVEDDDLFATGRMVFVGNGQKQLAI